MKKEYTQFNLRELFLIFVVPFLVYTVLVCVLKSTALQNIYWLWIFSVLVSEVVGFYFIIKKYGYFSILIGLVYFPAMYFFMYQFGFVIAGLIFGDFL